MSGGVEDLWDLMTQTDGRKARSRLHPGPVGSLYSGGVYGSMWCLCLNEILNNNNKVDVISLVKQLVTKWPRGQKDDLKYMIQLWIRARSKDRSPTRNNVQHFQLQVKSKG